MLPPGNAGAMSAVLKTGENHGQHFSFGKSFEAFKLNGGYLLRPYGAQ
jgi:hypothetical protein